jgi:hypothetical protein
MAINFSSNQPQVNSQFSLSPLELKMQQAIADGCLIIRLNIGANDYFTKPKAGSEKAQSYTPLVSNKGSLMFNAKGETFARAAQHGIIVWNPNKRSWDSPPASVKGVDGYEAPATGEKASGISAILLHVLRVSLQQANLEADLSLDTVWNEEFNFDLPLTKEELLNLRSQCQSERISSKKLTRSIVLAVRLLCDVDGEGNYIFKIKPVSLLSDNEAVIELRYGSAIQLTVDFYQQALDIAEQEEAPDQSDKLGQAALNFINNGGSKNSKRNANKKARKRAEAEERKTSSVDTSSSVEASTESEIVTELEVAEIPLSPADIDLDSMIL